MTSECKSTALTVELAGVECKSTCVRQADDAEVMAVATAAAEQWSETLRILADR